MAGERLAPLVLYLPLLLLPLDPLLLHLLLAGSLASNRAVLTRVDALTTGLDTLIPESPLRLLTADLARLLTVPEGLLGGRGRQHGTPGYLAVGRCRHPGPLHLRPEDALTFGGAVQTARLMGGQLGQAFVVTLTRVRTQTASNLIGQHVRIGMAEIDGEEDLAGNDVARVG